MLGVTVLWIIFVGLVWWAVSSISSLCQSIPEGDLCVKPMLNAVIAVPLALFDVYIAYIMIAQWFADRREEKEERKNTSRKEQPMKPFARINLSSVLSSVALAKGDALRRGDTRLIPRARGEREMLPM